MWSSYKCHGLFLAIKSSIFGATVVTFFLLLVQLTAVSGFIKRQNTFDNKVHNIYYIFLGKKIKFTCFFTLNNYIINEK